MPGCAPNTPRSSGEGFAGWLSGLDALPERFGTKERVEPEFGGKPGVERPRVVAAPGRAQRARLPVAPAGLLRERGRHRRDRRLHVGPGARAQRRTRAPGVLRVVVRGPFGLPIPVVGERMQLPRRVIRQPRVAVEAIGRGKTDALLLPGGARRPGVVARRPLERVEREIAAALRRPGELALGERPARVAVRGREIACGDPAVARHRVGNLAREADVAGLRREPEARAAIGDRQLAATDQGGEERLAGLRRRLPVEPERLRRRERRIAVALAAELDRIARELDVFARGRRVERSECVPVATLSEGLEGVDAKPLGERRIRPFRHEPARVVDRQDVEPGSESPVLDVRLEDVSR